MPTSDPSVTDAPTFTPGDVVKVPFPCTDRPTRQRRPALIVSGPDLQRTHGLSFEIEAEMPDGAPDQVVRTVTENFRTLTFTRQEFEQE